MSSAVGLSRFRNAVVLSTIRTTTIQRRQIVIKSETLLYPFVAVGSSSSSSGGGLLNHRIATSTTTAIVQTSTTTKYHYKVNRINTNNNPILLLTENHHIVVSQSQYNTKHRSTSHCSFSSSSSSNTQSNKKQQQHPFENTYGLAYTISPDHAYDKFIQWAQQEQGLNRLLLNPNSVLITAAYCPVWSFDMNIRYILTNNKTQQKRLDYKPEIFASVYGTQSIIHLPGLSAYAGYTYRRSLIDPLHSTTLVFLGDKLVPFGAWMLRDMKLLRNNTTISVIPDVWNTPQSRAIAIVKDGLESLATNDHLINTSSTVRVQTEIVSSKRVYMPTYVIQYTILGMEYQAFVSGCDDGVAVSGISHKVFNVDQTQLASATTNATGYISSAISFVQYTLRTLGGRQIGTLIVVALQFMGSLAARLLLRLPIIGALGGAFVGFRKIIQPWMDNRFATAEWERQREREASQRDKFEHIDDFTDTGTAIRYFKANKDRILRQFSDTSEHTEGSYSWYAEWEKWARQQWEQQQQQQQQQGYQQQQQRQQQPRQQKARPQTEYVWDFDPNDPYSVLGIKRGATAAEVTAAFRKQMMLHHPDTKSDSSEAIKARAIERSKIITNAYQSIKSQMKRR